MSKESSIGTLFTVWCGDEWTNRSVAPGHAGYYQRGEVSKHSFIKNVEREGWHHIDCRWHCPACAKAANNGN